MATISVRIDDEDQRRLDELAEIHGDRSAAVREAIRRLADEERRRKGLRHLLQEWEAEDGPVDQDAVEEMARRYGL